MENVPTPTACGSLPTEDHSHPTESRRFSTENGNFLTKTHRHIRQKSPKMSELAIFRQEPTIYDEIPWFAKELGELFGFERNPNQRSTTPNNPSKELCISEWIADSSYRSPSQNCCH
jgi:hypothetical protein